MAELGFIFVPHFILGTPLSLQAALQALYMALSEALMLERLALARLEPRHCFALDDSVTPGLK